jgi:hypothetical protein
MGTVSNEGGQSPMSGGDAPVVVYAADAVVTMPPDVTVRAVADERVDVEWEEVLQGPGGVRFVKLKLLGTFRNVIRDGRVSVVYDGDFTDNTATSVNCKVNDVLREIRVNVVKSKGKTIRRSSGVLATVFDNIGPADSATSENEGDSRGVCGDDNQDPGYVRFCCPRF